MAAERRIMERRSIAPGNIMPTRTRRVEIAQETVRILQQGAYRHPNGQRIVLADQLAAARSGSVLYSPGDFQEVFRRRDERLGARTSGPANFEVVNETTLHAARRLVEAEPGTRVLALNFASAKHPGGGFLKGSQAQEESLARASGLYACLMPFGEMYEANGRFKSALYTDHMIYAPDVAVFRDDQDAVLDRPYPVSFVTAPAVNVGALERNEPEKLKHVETIMRARMEKILSLAVVHGHEILVLGAWGCGVFANDPQRVAGWFHQLLTGNGVFHQAFRRIVFAVLDHTPNRSMIGPFERCFGAG